MSGENTVALQIRGATEVWQKSLCERIYWGKW